MTAKTVLITGATGMLGKDVYNLFSDDLKYRTYAINRQRNNIIKDEEQILIDLCETEKVKEILHNIQPDIIIHCAALTDVNKCEIEKEYAHSLHVDATQTLSQTCPNAKFIYISTDSVYDGFRGNYSETDETNPQNYYAITKLQGEDMVKKYSKESYLLRTNIFGFHIPLCKSLFEWGLDSLMRSEHIWGYENVIFNPIYTKDLSKIIKELVDGKFQTGIYNIGSPNHISKYYFLELIREHLNIDSKFLSKKNIETSINDVKRPLNTTLNIKKIQTIQNIPDLTKSFQRCLMDFFDIYENNTNRQ